MKKTAFVLLSFLPLACRTEPAATPDSKILALTCVEEIVEPSHGYLIAKILRSYDDANRIVDERLSDVDPRHVRKEPCYGGYGVDYGHARYIHTWTYDDAGRTIADRVDDLGDGTGCGGPQPATTNETTWDFDSKGLLQKERARWLYEGDTEQVAETVYEYGADGRVLSSVGPGGHTTWAYDAAGRPVSKELIYTNSVLERFLYLTSWEYDSAGRLALEVDRQSKPLDNSGSGSDGFFRVELRRFNAAGLVVEQQIDHHEYKPNSNYGPYGADGVYSVYDSHYDYTYDGAGKRTRETLIHDFLGGIVELDIAWERDAQGRVIKETRSQRGNDISGAVYGSRGYVYGPFGIVSVKGFDLDASLLWELQYDYDDAGRHVLTRDGMTETPLSANAYEYDAAGRVIRWRSDSKGSGLWDGERRYSYECGVDLQRELGRDLRREEVRSW